MEDNFSMIKDKIGEEGLRKIPILAELMEKSEVQTRAVRSAGVNQGPGIRSVRVNGVQFCERQRKVLCSVDILLNPVASISGRPFMNVAGMRLQEGDKVLSNSVAVMPSGDGISKVCEFEGIPEDIARRNIKLCILYTGYQIMPNATFKRVTDYREESTHIVNMESPIADIEVDNPWYQVGDKPKRGQDKDKVRVSFNRESQLSHVVDYDYTDKLDPQTSPTQRLFLKISGRIKLKSRYTYVGGSFDIKGVNLWKDAVHKTYKNQLPTPQSSGGKTVEWTLEPDWKETFEKTVEGVEYDGRFVMSGSLRVREDQTHEVEDVNFTICSYSDNRLQSQGALKVIPQIWFYWGCLSKHTRIKLADGSERQIVDVSIGDRVSDGRGQDARITNIWKGTEDTLIHIMTEQGNILEATRDHPVLTSNGMKQLQKLTSADRIVTGAGDTQAIVEAYPIVYEDVVYNLELDGGNTIVCNGLVTGDMQEQNRLAAESREKTLNLSPELEEEMRKLMDMIKE